MKKAIFGAALLSAMAVTPAMAGYSTIAVPPQIIQFGIVYDSVDFPVLQTSGPAISKIDFSINYPSAYNSYLRVRVCIRNGICDSTWRSPVNTTSFFNGYPIGTQFYVQVRMNGTVGVALSPPGNPIGVSSLSVL